MLTQKIFKPTASTTITYLVVRSVFSAPVKKFYKNVSISQVTPAGQSDMHYEVLLDQRKLRTPGGQPFLVPNEILAHAVAQEWDSQKDHIKRHTMHFTTLCNRVLDWQELADPAAVVQGIMQFADTDTICFRCDEPDDLVTMQRSSWDPVLQYVVERYSITPMITKSLVGSTVMSPRDRDVLTRHFLSYNPWGLVGLQSCVENLKSVFLALAAVDGFCSASKAVELSLLEQLFQVQRWGEVLSHHDIEMVELKARVSASVFLVIVSHCRKHVKSKVDLAAIRHLDGQD